MISSKRIADNLHYCYHHYNCYHANIKNDKKIYEKENHKKQKRKGSKFQCDGWKETKHKD